MMQVDIVYWEDKGVWLGYLANFPDHLTQGDSLEDLKEHLRSLYRDLTGDDGYPLTLVPIGTPRSPRDASATTTPEEAA